MTSPRCSAGHRIAVILLAGRNALIGAGDMARSCGLKVAAANSLCGLQVPSWNTLLGRLHASRHSLPLRVSRL